MRSQGGGHEALSVDEILSSVRVSLAPGESVKYATIGNLRASNKRRPPLQAYILVTDRRVIFTNRKGSFFMDMDLRQVQDTAIERQPPKYSNGIVLIVLGFLLMVFDIYSPIKANPSYIAPILFISAGITLIAEAKPLYVLTISGVGQQIHIYSTQHENVYELDRAIRSQREKIVMGQGEGEKK